MSLLPKPLLLLIGLQVKATVRRWGRGLRRPRGVIALVGTLGLLLLFLLPAIISPRSLGGRVPEAVSVDATSAAPSDLGPFIVLGIILLSILGTPADRALVFSRAEVDMLFPGPFSRRQLLLYNLARRFLPIVVISLFLGVVGRRFAGSIGAGVVGMIMLMVFVNLTTVAAALASQLLGEHRFRVLRRLLLAVVIGGVAAGSWWLARQESLDPLAAFRAFTASVPGRLVALPATPFARTLAADGLWAALLPWGLIALAINVALLVVTIRLDANWLEASSESSRKLHERLQRARSGGAASAAPARFAAVRVPMPPRLAGVGPLAWRQVTSAVRGSGRSLWMFLVVAVAVSVPLLLAGGLSESVLVGVRAAGPIVLGYLSFFAPQILRLDFRGDIDRLELLKALPVSAISMAIAQTVVAAGVVTALQAALFGLLLSFTALLLDRNVSRRRGRTVRQVLDQSSVGGVNSAKTRITAAYVPPPLSTATVDAPGGGSAATAGKAS